MSNVMDVKPVSGSVSVVVMLLEKRSEMERNKMSISQSMTGQLHDCSSLWSYSTV